MTSIKTLSPPLEEKEKISILLADPSPVYRQGIRTVLESEKDFHIVCEIDEVKSLLNYLEKDQPEIVIVDIFSQKGQGTRTIRKIRKLAPQTKILILTSFREELFASRCIQAGAQGYLTRHSSSQCLLKALREIQSGNLFINSQTASQLILKFFQDESSNKFHSQLSDREFEVFNFLGQGYSPQQIAQRLEVKPSTVETYRFRIRQKLGIESASELRELAIFWKQEKKLSLQT